MNPGRCLAPFLAVLLLAVAAGWAAEEEGEPAGMPGGMTGITGEEEERQQQRQIQQREALAPAAPAVQPASSQEQAKERLKTVVSISFTNADLRNVLSGLAKTYGLNIVADDTVKGSVNLTLKGVRLEEVLKQILRPNGFVFTWEDSIIQIVSLKEEVVTEVLVLDFIQPEVAMDVVKEEASETGILKVDDVQGGLLVTDKVSNLEAMKEILKKIDLPPQQVLIQARLLDITHTDQDNLGLKLSSVSFDIPLRANVLESLLKISSGALDVSGQSADLTSDTVTATVGRGSETLTAAIDALIRNKRVKVLASPTVSTLNNVEAKITIGEKFPIQETTQTTTGTLQTTRFVDVGITLRVTPKISKSGYIQMQIHPEVSSVSSTIDAGPRITTREADTTIIIRNRESVIIAGLIKEEETMIRDRIPGLGHIPFLGALFTNRSKSYEQKELVIVITPFLLPVDASKQSRDSEIQKADLRLSGTELFRQANDFEFGRTLQARDAPEMVRILRAVELYESMADQYPAHTLTPEALWRAGLLGWDRLKDSLRSQETLSRLATQYPNHPLALQARKQIKSLQAHLARRARNADWAEETDPKGQADKAGQPKRRRPVNTGLR